MALFDMGGRKPVSAQPQMPNVPVQQVASLKQQGLSDNQIIQSLQRDGYKTHQIFDAMNQADLVSGAARPLDEMPPIPPQESTYQDSAQQGFQNQPMQGQQLQYPQYPPQSAAGPAQFGEPNLEKIEEIAESIIEEKWNDFSKGLSKIIDWKERTELRINELDTRVTQLKQSVDELNKSLLGKMGEYDKNIGSVGSDIKALEKVFQQMLPSFTENINELSRITKNIKSKQ
jgi:uncharacterized coiled-coil protein SlyX